MERKKTFKIVFMGTPDFAVPCLEALIESADFEVALAITQPDKPAGRGKTITSPPIKKTASKYSLPITQPSKIKEAEKKIMEIKPDFIIVVAYGKIIPENILNIPKYGCVNVHASLLPRWRGAAVISAPILAGDKETGVTIMKMDKGLDTGPIILQKKIILAKTETAQTLHDKLAELGAKILPEALKNFASGKITPQKQNNETATYAKILKKEDGRIDWQKPAIEIERMIRAFYPWPGAYAIIDCQALTEKILKIIEVENDILPINKFKIGKIFLKDNKLAVQGKDGALVLKKIQLEGGKPLSAEEFLRGHSCFLDAILK